jgi:hypothetical protein
MSARLTKPLIVPEYNNGVVKLYTPDVLSGLAAPNPSNAINLQAVLNSLFPGQGRTARPNCCKLYGFDLFVAQSSGNSHAIIKFPGYLNNPAAAQTNAFVFTLDGNDYLDMAFDKAGRLYVAEGGFLNNQIFRYDGVNNPFPGQAAASGNNYNSKVLIGNAGLTSYMANLAFDTVGNLWVSDYLNNRIVAFDVGNLGTTNSFHALSNPGGALAVANSDPGLNAPTTHLFAQPEGLDFDDFGPTANLWVANNNDGGSGGVSTTLTTIVRITKALQTAVLGTAPNSTLASSQITANVNCFIYQVANGAAGRPQFGGLQVDKAAGRLYVNEQVNGNGRAYELATIAATKANPADSLLGIVSTNPGNGGIALLQLGAYVADNTLDRGYEPDTTSTRFWETLAISVTQNSAGPLAILPPSEDVNGGQKCYLYIQVQNFGPTPTLGIETLNLSWAKASSGPSWPVPWDGSIFDVPNFPTSAMGGSIADSVSIPVLPALGSVVVGPVPWDKAPDPKKYVVKDGHFCLLARIVTPGLGALGMSYPEGNNLGVNVLNNARIVQRNIHIITLNPAIGSPRSPVSSVLVSNYSGGPMNTRMAFELLDAEGRPLWVPAGRVLIGAEGVSLKALLRSSLGDAFNGQEQVALPDIEAGIDNLSLAPGETVAFTVDYETETPLNAYAIQVSQYAKESDGEKLIGGQTFVKGQVSGFPVRQDKPDGEDSPPTSSESKKFWWILVLLLALGIIIILIRK